MQVDIHTQTMASLTQASVLVLLIVSATIMAVNADVVSLTDATFTDKLKEENSLWLIKFYAPWCGYCKRLAPTWEELGKALEQEDGVEVATVDCTTSKATCTKNDIRSYPTIKLFYNGEELKKYSGPRDLESMKAFAVEAAAEVAKSHVQAEAVVL